MTRLCYPTDLPRGSRIVREGILVRNVRVGRLDGEPVAFVLGDDECERAYPVAERIEIDEDTPERAARLRLARDLIDGGY